MSDPVYDSVEDRAVAFLALGKGFATEETLREARETQRLLAGRGQGVSLAKILLSQDLLTLDQARELSDAAAAGPVPCPRCGAALDLDRARPSACASCGFSLEADVAATSPSALPILHTRPQTNTDTLAPPSDETLADLVGTTLGDCALTKLLGMGGMGAVYLAHHRTLGIDVAVKIIKPSALSSAEARDRFVREAQATVALEHENIMRITNLGEDRGLLYIVMQHLPGPSLADRMKKKEVLPPGEAVHVAVQLLEALDYAHGKGFIHRDVKPDNLMFDKDGRVRLTDFGLTRSQKGAKGITQTGAALGTPLFMPIEQWDNEKVDRRADIYAAGVTLYYFLSGEYPYDGDTPSQVLMKLVSGKPAPLDVYGPHLPKALVRAVHKMTAKNKKDRHRNAREAIDDLLAAMGVSDASELDTASPGVAVSRRVRSGRLPARKGKPALPAKALLLAGAPALLLALAVAAGFLFQGGTGDGDGNGAAKPDPGAAAPATPAAPAHEEESARERRLFDEASEGTLEDCVAYLKDFPDGPRADAVKERMAVLEEKGRLERAVREIERLVLGEVLEKEFWLPRGAFRIPGPITVAPRGRIVLPAGVTLRFAPGAGIFCYGAVMAEGTAAEPVTFEAEDPDRGWSNLVLLGPVSSASRLKHCAFSGGRGVSMQHRAFGGEFETLGAGTFGGMVLCGPEAGPIFEDCRFWGGEVQRWGGAAFLVGCQARFERCVFEGNKAQAGGGAYCAGGDTTFFSGCRFEGNRAGDCAGVFCSRSSAQFRDCDFLRNTADFAGGGAGLISSFSQLERCRFEGNKAHNGGGLCINATRSIFIGCVIRDNEAATEGGGLYLDLQTPQPRLEDSTVEGNRPDEIFRRRQ